MIEGGRSLVETSYKATIGTYQCHSTSLLENRACFQVFRAVINCRITFSSYSQLS